jgi:hypothetical protein
MPRLLARERSTAAPGRVSCSPRSRTPRYYFCKKTPERPKIAKRPSTCGQTLPYPLSHTSRRRPTPAAAPAPRFAARLFSLPHPSPLSSPRRRARGPSPSSSSVAVVGLGGSSVTGSSPLDPTRVAAAAAVAGGAAFPHPLTAALLPSRSDEGVAHSSDRLVGLPREAATSPHARGRWRRP